VTAPACATTWLPFGPDGGDARRIVADPSDLRHLYLGTTTGWIYESHDNGASWRRLARVEKRDDLVLDSIVVDARNPKHLIVGAWVIDHPDGGLYVSYDGGASWFSQAEMRGQSIRSLRASPTDPKELVAGTLKGVYRSTDGGQRWTLISPRDSMEIHEVQSVAIDPVDPKVIYAGTWHLPWKTTDGGEHWSNIKDGIIEDSDVFSIIVDPKSPKTVYASACSGIYKSEDAGGLFHKIQGIPSTARRTRVLMQDPSALNVVFAGTTEGLWRSDNAGKSWERKTGPEVVVNDVLVDKADSKHVLLATNRAGVLVSEDGGETFQPSNSGFSTRQVTAMQRDRNEPATVLVGVVNDKEAGGVFRSLDGGLTWKQLSEGLGGRDVFALAQALDGTFLAGTSHGLFRLDNADEKWRRLDDGSGVTDATNGLRPPAVLFPQPETHEKGVHKVVAKTPMKAPSRPTGPRRMTPAEQKAALERALREAAGLPPEDPLTSTPPPAVPEVAATVTPASPNTSAPEAPADDTPNPGSGPAGFDGAVYGLTTTGGRVLAITSSGLLASDDDGITWTATSALRSADWRFVASAGEFVIAATLHTLSVSANSGKTWRAALLPEGLTQVATAAVDSKGALWVGGREGVYVTHDNGNNWERPKDLYVNSVNSLYYDAPGNRMVVTTTSYSNFVFLVNLADMAVKYSDTGWSLRFARPIGDHLIAATLFDGVVVQPKTASSPTSVVVPPKSVHPLNVPANMQ
jgi:photosystem II stability/assembly factor-like uncharacterized protein